MATSEAARQDELDAMMADAVSIRRSQDAVWRRSFDALPRCVQQTLFQNDHHQEEDDGDEEEKRWESRLQRVWFLTLKPDAPHWSTRGVRDEWIDISITDKSEAVRCLLGLATCQRARGDASRALETCNTALKLGVTSEVLACRARCWLEVKSQRDAHALALTDLRKACELEPGNVEASQLLASVLASVRHHDQAARAAFGGIFIKPTPPTSPIPPPIKQLRWMLPSPLAMLVLALAVLYQVYTRLEGK